MCRIGPPDAAVGIAPAACRRHDGIEVLPQVGVCRYPTTHSCGVIVDRPVEQLFASRQKSQPAEFWNPKRSVFALLDAQPSRGMQPNRSGSGGGRFIAWKVALCSAEMPGADDDGHYCPPSVAFRLTRSLEWLLHRVDGRLYSPLRRSRRVRSVRVKRVGLTSAGRFRSSPINRHRQTGPVSLVPKHKTGSSTSIGRDSNDLSIVTNALGLDFFRVRFRRILSFRFTDSVAEGRDALCRIASRP